MNEELLKAYIRIMTLESMIDTYILDSKNMTIPQSDLVEWSRWFQTSNRQIKEYIVDAFRISTVFLGIDHNFHRGGKPLLFETMIFLREDWEDIYSDRCSTYDEALQMHEKAIKWLNDRENYRKNDSNLVESST